MWTMQVIYVKENRPGTICLRDFHLYDVL